MKKVDYREEWTSLADALRKEMIGKVVVISTRIHVIEIVSEKLHFVFGDFSFNLFPKMYSHKLISERLGKDYEREYIREDYPKTVFLRGEVYMSNFLYSKFFECDLGRHISIRPVQGIPFIVGDDEHYF